MRQSAQADPREAHADGWADLGTTWAPIPPTLGGEPPPEAPVFCSGLLRSRSFPKTMRRSRTAPLVKTEAECCCSGILTAMPVELPWWQSITFGTTAWRVSMARRQGVESANPAPTGAFADLSRGFFRVMGLVKTTVLLGFTLAAYNFDRIRSFKAKHGLGD